MTHEKKTSFHFEIVEKTTKRKIFHDIKNCNEKFKLYANINKVLLEHGPFNLFPYGIWPLSLNNGKTKKYGRNLCLAKNSYVFSHYGKVPRYWVYCIMPTLLTNRGT
jgi:hypothetical protein